MEKQEARRKCRREKQNPLNLLSLDAEGEAEKEEANGKLKLR
jgi:hypothetical protein